MLATIIAAAALQTSCPGGAQVLSRYRSYLGDTSQYSWALHGSRAGYRFEGLRSTRGYWTRIAEPGGIEISRGLDRAGPWAKGPNGFVGSASEYRAKLERAEWQLVSGQFLSFVSVDGGCLRSKGTSLPVRLFQERGGVPLAVIFARNGRGIASAIIDPLNARIAVDNVDYVATPSGHLVGSWRAQRSVTIFTAASRTSVPDRSRPAITASAVSTPFDLALHPVEGRAEVTVTSSLNGSAAELMFDTGANTLIINAQFARKHRFRLIGHSSALGFGGSRPSSYYLVNRVRIGSLELRDVVATAVEDTFGHDGWVGASLLAAGRVTIDVPHLRVHIEPSRARGADEGALDTLDTEPMADGTVDRGHFEFLLDTGAEAAFVLPERSPGKAMGKNDICSRGASARTTTGYLGERTVVIGRYTFEAAPVCMMEKGTIFTRSDLALVGIYVFRMRPLMIDLRAGAYSL